MSLGGEAGASIGGSGVPVGGGHGSGPRAAAGVGLYFAGNGAVFAGLLPWYPLLVDRLGTELLAVRTRRRLLRGRIAAVLSAAGRAHRPLRSSPGRDRRDGVPRCGRCRDRVVGQRRDDGDCACCCWAAVMRSSMLPRTSSASPCRRSSNARSCPRCTRCGASADCSAARPPRLRRARARTCGRGWRSSPSSRWSSQ
jgi:hypothetical protein